MFGTNTELQFSSDEFIVTVNGEEYLCGVYAEANHWYSPGCMYRRNGDPGDPPEDELEITKLEVTGAVHLLDGDVEGSPATAEELELVRDAVTDDLYEMDYDRWTA